MDWSYVACFIDTDGSMSLCPKTNPTRCQILFYNISREYISILHCFLNSKKANIKTIRSVGHIYSRPPKGGFKTSKTLYVLIISSKRHIHKILKKVIPKMILKKDKAKKCLE